MLVTLSGLDGAGKTALIHRLAPALKQQGHSVVLLTMYDHVGVYATVRALLRRFKTAFHDEALPPTSTGQLADDASGNGKGWSLKRLSRSTIVKRAILPFDIVVFSFMRLYLERFKGKIIILDRYFYDSIADVTAKAPWATVRALLALVPAASLPVFVDVSPQEAYDRKGEYPVAYMERRRKQYQRIFGHVANSLTLVNDDLETTVSTLIETISLKAHQRSPRT
jgi:thymidylate kinase